MILEVLKENGYMYVIVNLIFVRGVEFFIFDFFCFGRYLS